MNESAAAAAATAMTSPAKPLSGITVLDLTRLLPGPMSTRHLVDMGARVIKIQSPDPAQADYAKTMGAENDMDGDATFFYRHCNTGKDDVLLDLKQPSQREQFLNLCANADAVIESFRPGVMAKLGLSFETLQTANPAISLVSITGFGQHGAWAGAAGHDINYMALSGQLIEFCNENDEVTLPNIQYGDLLGGAMSAAFATVSAVLHAKLHGRGCWVDVSMTASLLAHTVMPLFALQATGTVPLADQALLNGGVPCYRVYRTQDARHLAVGALELKFWQAFCKTVGRPGWAAQHWSLGSHAPGDAASTTLRLEVEALIASHTLAHWTAVFSGADCCTTPVLRMDEALLHPANADYGTVGSRKAARGKSVPTLDFALKALKL